MSADKYYLLSLVGKAKKNSIFALKMGNDKSGESSGEIYYFNKNEEKNEKIEKLSEFNEDEKKFHIIVYNGRYLEYYKPGKDKINDEELLEKLNEEYAKCIIINITVEKYTNTYIFLREQSKKISTDRIFEKMKIENQETFKKYNLINIVRALFNIIEDYYINIDGVKKEEKAVAADADAEEANLKAAEEKAAAEKAAADKAAADAVVAESAAAEKAAAEKADAEKVRATAEKTAAEYASDVKAAEEARAAEEVQAAAAHKGTEDTLRKSKSRRRGYGGNRKLKRRELNQKSLKKMSTIIKKLLKINLNIKPVAKPTAKPTAKPKAKPKAKPAAKPKAKPTAKPKAKPVAKSVAKPKAKPTAKPKAKPVAKPKAKPVAKPTAKPKAKPAAKPKAKK